jgi:uncharacterized protein
MSQENVEIVRAAVDAFSGGDWDDALVAFHPEVAWVETPSLGPDASSCSGIAEVREAVGKWVGAWGDYNFDVARFEDAGDDVVFLAREHGHGGISGATVERELGAVYTLRNGKVVRVRLYGNWREALEAAGLRK